MKKLRVALQLRDTDIVQILRLADFVVTESELGAIFRNEDHPNYKPCGDQLLRNFLNGLIIYKRGPAPDKSAAKTDAQKPAPKPAPKPAKPQLRPPSGKNMR